MIIHCKNLEKSDNNPYITETGLIKVGENTVFKDILPQIEGTNVVANRYLNFANLLYVVTSNAISDIEKTFIIEQVLDNGKIKIKNIYSTIRVGELNELHEMFNYNKEYIKSVLERDILNALYSLDYAINLDNLQEQIKQVLDRKEVSIPELEIPKPKIELSKSISELAREAGVSYGTMWSRIRVHNMSPEEAIKNAPIKKEAKKVIEYNGKTYGSLKEFCEAFDIRYKTAWRKINFSGYTPEEVINGKKRGKKDAKSK